MLIKDWPDKELLGERLDEIVRAQEELWDRMRMLERYLGTDLDLEEWAEHAAVSPGDNSALVDGFIAEFGNYDTDDNNG